jgi:hypothetical protein
MGYVSEAMSQVTPLLSWSLINPLEAPVKTCTDARAYMNCFGAKEDWRSS